MAVSYKKLWKLLIDHDMKKKDLAKVADISNYTITKMSKGENVTVETLGKICAALNCGVDDIMEFIPEGRCGPPVLPLPFLSGSPAPHRRTYPSESRRAPRS